jgi:hypothetical protein
MNNLYIVILSIAKYNFLSSLAMQWIVFPLQIYDASNFVNSNTLLFQLSVNL